MNSDTKAPKFQESMFNKTLKLKPSHKYFCSLNSINSFPLDSDRFELDVDDDMQSLLQSLIKTSSRNQKDSNSSLILITKSPRRHQSIHFHLFCPPNNSHTFISDYRRHVLSTRILAQHSEDSQYISGNICPLPELTSKSQETKASRDSSIQKVDPPTDCDNLVRSKEVKSENITLLNKENEELVKPDVNTNGNKPTFGSVGRIVEQGDAWFIIPPTGIDGPYSQNQNGTYSSISSIVSDFPSMSHSVGRSNGSSKSLLSTFYTPTMKRRQRLPIPSEFLNSATLGTVSSKPPTPSKDGIGRVPTTNLQSEVNRSSDQDSGLSSQLSAPLHAIDMESQNEDYLPKVVNNNPTEISSATRWTTTLRQSMKRANNRRILLAGCTIFNRNPVEGINYLIRNYTLVSNPSKIAHFLLNEPNLNRQAIGEYFGLLDNPMATKVLKEFLLLIDMKGMEVDNALRSVIGHFHPSGESQKIAHLMQIFQEVYIHQNPDRVHRLFRNSETVEVLAYSVLLLHTDLHNPNVGKMGKRMTKQGFINNNRGIDSNHDVSKDLLEGIYDRVAASEFKTLPDPSDRLRALDGVLVGPLKTDNFVQRHRRFIGRVLAQQIEKIAPRRLPSKNNSRWRYLLIFNDILLVVKSLSSTRLRSDSLMNTAAAVAMGDQNVSRHYTPRNSISSVRNQNPKDQSGNVRSRSSSGVVQDVAQKIFCSTEPFVSDTSYQVRNVFPFLDLRVLVFESNYYRYGVQLCNSSGPVISLNMSSETCRRQFIDWVYESIAEMEELQQHQQMKQTVCEKNIIIKSGLNSSNTSIVREDNSSSVSSSSMKKKVILSNP
uniref:SEC7 domain-containing protein n=1 Tax=Trichobilharzia regenti TaxID=157069 RepID=A0AA85JW96_TRIRE|nr:unnamed protein product [Trichobilharzia regenti]